LNNRRLELTAATIVPPSMPTSNWYSIAAGPWHRVATPDKSSGMLLCGSQQGNSMVAWSNDAELLVSVINAEAAGPSIDQLYGWWMPHS
jgi:hypothetical protein